jgi:SRSO17 transposase
MSEILVSGQTSAPVSATDIDEWSADLDKLHHRIASRFEREEVRARSRRFLAGLLGRVERKNGWQLAEYAKEQTPDGMQRLLAKAKWDAEVVRDDLRSYVVEQLGDPEGVMVVDETGFLKKGPKSVGVKRQYSGTAGKVENCQVGVLLAYASPKGHAFIDRELYLPKEWAEDRVRRDEAGVPAEVEFATKPQLAKRMLERAFAAGVRPAWVAGDEVYGGDRALWTCLEGCRQPFVLGLRSNEYVWVERSIGPWQGAAGEVALGIAPGAWQRLSAGNGSKGPRVYDWATVPLVPPPITGWGRWLLVRRSPSDVTDLAYYIVFGPTETTIAEMVRVAGSRWAIEESIEMAKGEAGLDQYEVRRWTPWYRHITLSLLAHAFLVATRAKMAVVAQPNPETAQGVKKGAMQATCAAPG